MNVSPLLLQLKDVTGFPVVPDVYDGPEDKWITFSYEDERSALDGDNYMIYERATIQVSLFTPVNYNYFSDKKKIKKALIDMGFCIEYMKSWVSTYYEQGTSKCRQTVFVCNYTAEED